MSNNFKNAIAMSLTLSLGMVLGACGNGNASSANVPTPTKDTQQAPTKGETVTSGTTNSQVNHSNNKAGDDVKQVLQANLDKAGISTTVLDVTPISMPDMYFATLENMPPIFTDKTGTYLLQGSLISLESGTPVNISEQVSALFAKQALANVDKSEMIIFSPKGKPKASVYVFSDPTCHYCQVLHRDMSKLNAEGIEVRYLAWPRGEDLTPLAESVWCNADRQQAITDAKAGKHPKPATCDNPVQKHIALGHSLGVSGTPAVFTTNGTQIGGYLPPAELAQAAIENQ